MNIDRDKLIDMAKEAGMWIPEDPDCEVFTITQEELAKFAELVSAHAITSMQGDSEPVANFDATIDSAIKAQQERN